MNPGAGLSGSYLISLADQTVLIWPTRVFPNTASLYFMVGLVTAVAVIIAIWWLGRRVRRWRSRLVPVVEFWRLGGRLGLSPIDRWRLIRIARRGGLSSPIALLLSPSTLRHHAQACYAVPADHARAIEGLTGRVFG
jgi:hypothetical protein